MKKYKVNRKGGSFDLCQTPPYAIEPLVSHLKTAKFHTIWEPACGKGLMVSTLKDHGFDVIATDILEDRPDNNVTFDFFRIDPLEHYDCIITNPPYSVKYDWLKRCYELGKPFALLLPVETIGAKAAQVLFDRHDVQVIWVRPRIDFKMPNKGWSGKGAQFPTAWFTWQFDLPKDNMFAKLYKVKYE